MCLLFHSQVCHERGHAKLSGVVNADVMLHEVRSKSLISMSGIPVSYIILQDDVAQIMCIMIEQAVLRQCEVLMFYTMQLCCMLMVCWWQLSSACCKFKGLPLFGCSAWRRGRACFAGCHVAVLFTRTCCRLRAVAVAHVLHHGFVQFVLLVMICSLSCSHVFLRLVDECCRQDSIACFLPFAVRLGSSGQ
jgi:hypothetical protein